MIKISLNYEIQWFLSFFIFFFFFLPTHPDEIKKNILSALLFYTLYVMCVRVNLNNLRRFLRRKIIIYICCHLKKVFDEMFWIWIQFSSFGTDRKCCKEKRSFVASIIWCLYLQISKSIENYPFFFFVGQHLCLVCVKDLQNVTILILVWIYYRVLTVFCIVIKHSIII